MTRPSPRGRPCLAAVSPNSSAKNRLRWRVSRGLAGLESCASAWDELALRTAQTPTADALWMRCFWRAFGEDDESLFIHSLYRGDSLLAVLPLRRIGCAVRKWVSVTNVHTPYCLIAMDVNDPLVTDEILDHLLGQADMLEIERLPLRAPLHDAFVSAARSRGLVVVENVQGGDHVVDLCTPWERCLASLPTRMRRETGRKMRQLDRLGRVDFEMLTSGPELSSALKSSFELEALGWKGTSGSPIKNAPRTLRFYTDLAQESAARGRFALYSLKFNGRLIAYEYCLRALGKIDQLKPSFHPDFASYSPGNILRYKILQKEVSEGNTSSYHLGSPAAWKRHWTKRVDALVRLRIYGRGARGRLGYYAGPGLRGMLKRSNILRSAAQWARRMRLIRG